jgi:UDP-GlcNAc:undecaprenyl-phosphate GlcNAc-1-phosphate transferase
MMYELTPTILLSVPWLHLILSFSIAAVAILFLAPLARRTGWIDHPTGRKSHEGAVPLIGGWGLLIALLVVQALAPDVLQAPSGFWIGAFLLFFTSLADDRRPIRARYRLMVQLTVAVSGVSLGGQMLPSLGNLFDMGEVVSPWLVVPVSIIGTMALINAVNFSDGADGLCGGISLIALGWLAFAVSIAAGAASGSASVAFDYAQTLLPIAVTLMGALAGFLCFNLRAPWRKKASVFMGDSGSTLVGFTLAWIAIHATSAYGSESVSPVACLWIVAMPLADAASCFVRRLLAGVTPMTADLRHFHHLLGAHGLPVAQSADGR